jgi:hypothetical protein
MIRFFTEHLKAVQRGTNLLFWDDEIVSDCRHSGRLSTNITIFLLLFFYDAARISEYARPKVKMTGE